MVSQLLGHSSRETTEQIYLAPVRHLPLALFLDEAASEIGSAQDLMSLAAAFGPPRPGCGAVKATQKRTAAVAPDSGYSRPRMVDAEGLSVSVRTEDGDTKVFDFRSAGAPPDLVQPLVAAFAKVSGPAGTWRQMRTVYGGWKALRRFLVFVGDEYPNVTTIAGLTEDVWKHWRVRRPIWPLAGIVNPWCSGRCSVMSRDCRAGPGWH